MLALEHLRRIYGVKEEAPKIEEQKDKAQKKVDKLFEQIRTDRPEPRLPDYSEWLRQSTARPIRYTTTTGTPAVPRRSTANDWYSTSTGDAYRSWNTDTSNTTTNY